jgi:putative ABC transport system ATP-binding protein
VPAVALHDLLVEIRGVSKAYVRGGQAVPVLENITLDIERGDFTALMGPSGSGKTTLLNLIAGIDKPDAGSLRVDGVDITTLGEADLADWRAGHVGFIFQFYNLLPVLTAFQNVELPLLLTKLNKAERKKRVETALRVVSLEERMDHYPRQLSGGQEQRVAIARAIVTDPAIILADEPTGNLDSKTGVEILGIFDDLSRRGVTIVLVTHDPIVARHAHRVIHLKDGRIERIETNDRAAATAGAH